MDCEISDRQGISEKVKSKNSVDSANLGISEDLKTCVGDYRSDETVIIIRSDHEGEIASMSGENGDLNAKMGESDSSESAMDRRKDSEDKRDLCVIDVEHSGGKFGDKSNDLAVDDESETVIVVRSDVKEETASISGGETKDLNAKRDELGSSKSPVDEGKSKDSEDEQKYCVIDVKCNGGKLGEDLEGERVCRICHLSSDQSLQGKTSTTTASTDLIQLGCGCKDELGIAHSHCAEAWFKLRGNRQCEICGEIAKHITGVGDNRFMEEWNERRSTSSGDANSSEGGRGCWRGQPFCNFLMACLVIAFVLPWFFRVNMF